MKYHSDQECDFCRIVRGELGARVVCETEAAIAFFPLDPAALGHTLVIPRTHIADLWGLDREVGAGLGDALLRVAVALRAALRPDGLNVIQSSGEAASQTVLHLHIHLVPRWTSDHLGNLWPPGVPWGESVKDEVADRVRRACAHVS